MTPELVTDGGVVTKEPGAGVSSDPVKDATSLASAQEPKPGQKDPVDDARVRGLLADLQKERTARQGFEQKLTEATTRHTDLDRRFKALAGVTEPSEAEAERFQIRERLKAMVPELSELIDGGMSLKEIKDTLAEMKGLQQSANAGYMQRGRAVRAQVLEAATDAYGGTLSERQQNRLIDALVFHLATNDELRVRYEEGDDAPITAFVNEYIEDFIKPAARQATAQDVNRLRPVPRGRDRNIVATAAKKIDFTDDKAIMDAMVEDFQVRGGEFGRR